MLCPSFAMGVVRWPVPLSPRRTARAGLQEKDGPSSSVTTSPFASCLQSCASWTKQSDMGRRSMGQERMLSGSAHSELAHTVSRLGSLGDPPLRPL